MRLIVLSLLTALSRVLQVSSAPEEPLNLPTCDVNFGTSLPPANPYLPNPFQFASTVTTVQWFESLWQCRRQEIGNLMQQYELGTLPGPPDSFQASFDNGSNNMTITATNGGNSLTFVVPFTYPNDTGVPQGGYPAMITYGAPTIPIPSGVVIIEFDNSNFAVQNNASNRGQGQFYELYGSNATAGAMIAWTWGVSRILDSLHATNNTGVDPSRVGITGCSRDGKGALVAGAFEERLVLTIPQESGSGGTTCWRLSDAEEEAGNAVQTLAEIVTENVWFSTEFDQFVDNTTLLPFDHHELIGLVAPRGLFIVDNSQYAWLSPQSAYGCAVAGGAVFQALNASGSYGHSQLGQHQHCNFPAGQGANLTAFLDKFLFQSSSADLSVNFTDVGHFNYSQWINWEVPTIWTDDVL